MKKSLFLLFLCFLLTGMVMAQSKDEKEVADVLLKNTSSFEKNDMATMDKIWANDQAVTVFENGYANYGWLDYRNTHLAPEMTEMKNVKYGSSEVKIKVSGKTAWATFKYTISGEHNGRNFDSGGLGTSVLEKRDGRWQIVHWHTSAPRRQPAAAPPAKPSP